MHSFTPLRPKPEDNTPARDGTQRGFAPAVRRNTSRACRSCRAKKTKCDGRSPTCSNCANLRTECVYELNSDKRRKEGWKSLVDDLQRRNRELEDTVSSLKCNSLAEAIERLQQLRDNQLPSFANEEQGASRSPALASEDRCKHDSGETRSPSGSRQNRPPSSSWQSNETLRSSHDTPLFGTDCTSTPSASVLPPEEVTRQATSSFTSCAAAYFYIMPPDACRDLIMSIYEQSTVSSKCDFCQLCAIAAVGAKYCTNGIPDSVCRRYFQLATLLLQDTIEDNPLAAMRVCICLSVYLVLDKMTSARAMLAAGLSITRSSMPKWMGNANDADVVEWSRIFRTMAFTECWLASVLGYTYDLKPGEIGMLEDFAALELYSTPLDATNPRWIQLHIYKISLISAQIDARLRDAAGLSEHELGLLSAKLDSWLNELPEPLSLNVTSHETFIPDIMPLLLMHMVYITARVTFYERVVRLNLDPHETTSGRSVAKQVLSLPEDVCDIYAVFAQQVARIVGLFNENQCIIKNCWIAIHSSYHAALALLLRAMQHLALGPSYLGLADLSSAYTCVQALETCSEKDVAAMRLSSRVSPSYQRLKQIADNRAMSEQMDATPQTETGTDDLSQVASQLVAGIALHFQESWI